MKTKDKQLSVSALYILLGIVMLFAHIFIVTGTNDDAWFAKILDEYDMIDYLLIRYHNWTSRLPIEAVVIILSRMNPWVWKVFNVLVVLLLVYECNYIFGDKCDAVSIVRYTMLILLLPPKMLSSAGWIATTVNYLWPITIGIYTLVPLCRWFRGEKLHVLEFVLGCVACIFACSQEQMALVLLTENILIVIYCMYSKHKVPILMWIYCVTAGAMTLFILTCPGNAVRSTLETSTWFPEFAELTFGNKVLTGVLSTFSYYVSCGEYNIIFLMFVLVLMLAVFDVTQKWFLRCLAAFPVIVTLFWGLGGRVIMRMNLTSKTYWLSLIQNDRIALLSAYGTEHIVLECCIFLAVLCTVVISLFVVHGKSLNSCVSITILFAALCSRIILGLSPTVYASGARTATLGCICLLILIFMCIQRRMHGKYMKRLYVPCYILMLIVNVVAIFK